METRINLDLLLSLYIEVKARFLGVLQLPNFISSINKRATMYSERHKRIAIVTDLINLLIAYGVTLMIAGPSVLPADPHERVIARFWAMYIDDKLLSSFVGILKAMTEETTATKILDTIVALEQLEGAFKNCSGGKKFFGGDTIGFLDVTLGCQLTWIKATGLSCLMRQRYHYW
ncbi:putative glutathione S-transferase GSTU6 [Carex rostrata]